MKLENALAVLGWNQATLARRLKVHRNTVSRWGSDCPPWVLEYLRVCALAKNILDG